MLLSSEEGNYVAWKYIYVFDKEIKGYKTNDDNQYTSTSSNIKFTPQRFVLRKVIGV